MKVIQKKNDCQSEITTYAKVYLSSFKAATSSLAFVKDSLKA